ncbi:aminoglycoside phosphotransferase family protein [Streptomyces olivaceus]|nr:aminoglycoside phosphotransferase family protein [Streptomyces olivaceus]MBZ6170134.1 aminoglycoside phosphotransferase family protein [Streptomyces olivaceus]
MLPGRSHPPPLEASVSTTAVSTSPNSPPPTPSAAEVFAFADREISTAAATQWPHADLDLGDHIPSVTTYVRRIRVDGRPLYAKYSLLGMSLVSLLRGACGPWPQARVAQQEYVQRRDALIEREAAQLRLLARAGRPRVCPVPGVRRGVLFTEPVTGISLARLLLDRRQDSAGLLATTLGELRELHRPAAVQRLGPAGAIGERSIAGTFQRKFNGLSGPAYVQRLGADQRVAGDREGVVAVLRQVIVRLHRIRARTVPQQYRRVLAYGDLKPEHVLFPDGVDQPPVFIDPGLLLAGTAVDVAKLTSRSVLTLAAARPGPKTGQHLVDGIASVTAERMEDLPLKARRSWLAEVLLLWLMDSVNILTTYLSAPAELPLPHQGTALVGRTADLCQMLDRISASLAAADATSTVWETALDHAQGIAA